MSLDFLTDEERKRFDQYLPSWQYPSYIFGRVNRNVICPECETTEHEIIMYPSTIVDTDINFRVGIIHFCPYCGLRGDRDNPYWYFVRPPQQITDGAIENMIKEAKIKIIELGCPVCGEHIPKELLEDVFRIKPRAPKQLTLSL